MKIGLQLTQNPTKYNYLLNNLKKLLDKNNIYKFININNETKLQKSIFDLDILVCYQIKESIFNLRSDKLKWIHFGASGIDSSLSSSVVNSKVIITNSKGINSDSVSDYVIGMMLYFSNSFFECINFKLNKKWNQWKIAKTTYQLNNKTIGIIGYGCLGKSIAKKAKAFNMNTIAIKRLQKIQQSNRYIDELLPLEKINYLLKESDFIVIACPLTPYTKNMITKNDFDKMKSSSVIINPSRGGIVNEEDLVFALKKNKIYGAALDVFNIEPLPEQNDLFNLDNVFLSPHISGNFPGYQDKVIDVFAMNLNLFMRNKQLKNKVCKKRLY